MILKAVEKAKRKVNWNPVCRALPGAFWSFTCWGLLTKGWKPCFFLPVFSSSLSVRYWLMFWILRDKTEISRVSFYLQPKSSLEGRRLSDVFLYFFKLIFIYFTRNSELQWGRDTVREISVLWFIPQMAAVARAGQVLSQELLGHPWDLVEQFVLMLNQWHSACF